MATCQQTLESGSLRACVAGGGLRERSTASNTGAGIIKPHTRGSLKPMCLSHVVQLNASILLLLYTIWRPVASGRDTEELVGKLEQGDPSRGLLAFPRRYPQSLLSQYLIVLTKNTVCYWRYPT